MYLSIGMNKVQKFVIRRRRKHRNTQCVQYTTIGIIIIALV